MTVVAGESTDVQLSVNTELFKLATANEETVGVTVRIRVLCSSATIKHIADTLTRRPTKVYSNAQVFNVITFIGNHACIDTLMGGHNGGVGDGGFNNHLARVVIVTKDHIKGITLNGGQDRSIWTNPLSNSRSTRTREAEQLGNPSIRAALQDRVVDNATNSTTNIESSTYMSREITI